MSLNLELYHNPDDNRVVEKNISKIGETIEGTFRNESSITNPVILLEWSGSAKRINYFYLPIYDRYYYVTEIIRVRDELIEIHGRCDVLMSFKEEILKMTGIIKRSANRYNLYLDDGSLKVYNKPDVFTQNFPYGFQNQEFVLAVAGS